jgi:hypothetical protein
MITVTDSNGRKFDNFSSLVFDWSLSNPSLAFLSDSISLSTEIIHDRKIVNSKYSSRSNFFDEISGIGCHITLVCQ